MLPLCLLLLFLACATCSNSRKELLIIDVDPAAFSWSGLDIDDDLALIAALAIHNATQRHATISNSEAQIEILGITAVAGNAPIRHAFPDARELTQSINPNIPVHSGASWFLPFLSHIRSRTPTDAASFIVSEVMSHPPHTITILALGPLSNIASAILMSGGAVATRLKRIVIMGGDLSANHIDFNFRMDTHAANMVLQAPVPKLVVPIQSCAQVTLSQPFLTALTAHCSAASTTHLPPLFCSFSQRLFLQIVYTNIYFVPMFRADGPILYRLSDGLVNESNVMVPWDIIALLLITHPKLFQPFVQLRDVHITDNNRMNWEIDESANFDLTKSNNVLIPGNLTVPESAVTDVIRDLLVSEYGRPITTPNIPLWLAFGIFFELGIALFCISLVWWFARRR